MCPGSQKWMWDGIVYLPWRVGVGARSSIWWCQQVSREHQSQKKEKRKKAREHTTDCITAYQQWLRGQWLWGEREGHLTLAIDGIEKLWLTLYSQALTICTGPSGLSTVHCQVQTVGLSACRLWTVGTTVLRWHNTSHKTSDNAHSWCCPAN